MSKKKRVRAPACGPRPTFRPKTWSWRDRETSAPALLGWHGENSREIAPQPSGRERSAVNHHFQPRDNHRDRDCHYKGSQRDLSEERPCSEPLAGLRIEVEI